MLLEMDIQDLRDLLNQPDLLNKKIQLACEALQEENTSSGGVS